MLEGLSTCGVYIIIGVDAVLLTASILYFALATHYPNVTYISDLDYDRIDYRIGITILVMLQIVSNAIYAFSRKRQHWIEFVCVTVAMAFAVVGWCVVSFAPDSSPDRFARNNSDMHLTGARLYVFGSLVTALFLCRDAWRMFWDTRTNGHLLLFVAVTASVVLACLFGLLFSRRDRQDWIYEHLLFLAYIVCHLLFFVNIITTAVPRAVGAQNDDEAPPRLSADDLYDRKKALSILEILLSSLKVNNYATHCVSETDVYYFVQVF